MRGIARHIQPPPAESLPSTRRLLLLSAVALLGVATVAVTIVLPAERAIDPTGLGRLTGLEMMGRIKLELAMDAADHEYADEMARTADSLTLIAATSDTAGAGTSDEIRIGIAPRDSSEVTLVVKRGAVVSFSWSVDSGAVGILMFGDSLRGARRATHRYRRDVAQSAGNGELVAAFDGVHGWRWYNSGNTVATILLRTRGRYLGGRHSSSAE